MCDFDGDSSLIGCIGHIKGIEATTRSFFEKIFYFYAVKKICKKNLKKNKPMYMYINIIMPPFKEGGAYCFAHVGR